jgi:hypothetical protein
LQYKPNLALQVSEGKFSLRLTKLSEKRILIYQIVAAASSSLGVQLLV